LTLIALIPPRILIAAMRTSPADESIGQEQIAILTVALSHLFLLYSIFLVDIQKYLLAYLGMPFCGRPSEMVESNVKPFIDLCVNFVVVVTNLPRGLLLLHCFNLSRCTVLISSANVQDIRALQPSETCVHISG
jgi:hypothetical protein